MAFEPTAAQQAAIDARGNILVSAAAGSGKTAVLVERVIKMLTDESNPVNADRRGNAHANREAAGRGVPRQPR